MDTSTPYLSDIANVTRNITPRWIEIVSACWLCVVLLLGALLNGWTILVFVMNRSLVTKNNVYVIALLLNDLALCCLATALPIVAEVSGHWLQLMNMNSCVFEAFTVYLFGLASMFVLVAIAVSRYIGITRPFLAARFTKMQSVYAVCISELFALFFAMAPMFGWGSYGLEVHGTSCGLAWTDRSEAFLSYLITITAVCFVIPMATMIFCYIRIYVTVKHSGRRGTDTVQRNCAQADKEMALLKISIAFVLAFVISWTPYTIVSFYVAYAKPESLNPLLSRSAALVAKSQVLWNPVLYIIINKQFRRKIFSIRSCKCREHPTTVTACVENTLGYNINTNAQTRTLQLNTPKVFKTTIRSHDSSKKQTDCKNMPHSSKYTECVYDLRNMIRVRANETDKSRISKEIASKGSDDVTEIRNIPSIRVEEDTSLNVLEEAIKLPDNTGGTVDARHETIQKVLIKGTSVRFFVREKASNTCCDQDHNTRQRSSIGDEDEKPSPSTSLVVTTIGSSSKSYN